MQPRDLNAESFATYPPLARKTAVEHLALLSDLPLTLAASLLREVIDLDDRFPAERATVESQLAYLGSLSADQRHRVTKGFAQISLPAALVAEDWVRSPQRFSEDLSAHLWASRQIDAFHAAGVEFVEGARKATPAERPAIPRLAIVILGPELRKDGFSLFRKLRPQGTFFPKVEGGDGTSEILKHLSKRASKSPAPYGHWYIDGGSPIAVESNEIKKFGWVESSSVRDAVLRKMRTVIGSVGAGPEMLRSILAEWTAKDQGAGSGDSLVDRLVLNIYGEGSGTQIFSTTFVQWSAREVLRRAEPLSLVARFGPRQRQRGMNEMIADPDKALDADYPGSLVDADFAAYYTWINLHRLAGAEAASFVAWSEAYGQAVAAGPGFPRGIEAPNSIKLDAVLGMIAQG